MPGEKSSTESARTRTVVERCEFEFQKLRRLADSALVQLTDSEFFSCRQGMENSCAIIVKHVAGNQRSRWADFLTSDGEKPTRDRDAEFVVSNRDERAALMESWELGWGALDGALAELWDKDLAEIVTIRGEEHSVLQAILRQLSHYAYHCGQIVLLAKAFRGEEWVSPSIPRGKSASFNAKPRPYL